MLDFLNPSSYDAIPKEGRKWARKSGRNRSHIRLSHLSATPEAFADRCSKFHQFFDNISASDFLQASFSDIVHR
jgi:hypothetical protein